MPRLANWPTSYVKNVDDVVKLGDKVRVKVIAIDDQGRVKLSRKQAMEEEGEEGEGEPVGEAKD